MEPGPLVEQVEVGGEVSLYQVQVGGQVVQQSVHLPRGCVQGGDEAHVTRQFHVIHLLEHLPGRQEALLQLHGVKLYHYVTVH